MFDFLMEWIFNYTVALVFMLVLGIVIGIGARDLMTCFTPEHETAGAAYDACEDEASNQAPRYGELPPPDHNEVARRLLNY
jgi:hypothetical protein